MNSKSESTSPMNQLTRTQLQIIILAEALALHEESKDGYGNLDDTSREEFEMLLVSHLDRLSISDMLENENDFSEQFMREIILPLYDTLGINTKI